MNALEYALTLLSRSDKTERKLYEALLKKGFSEEESAGAVERVKDYGYAGDEAFSRRYVEFNSDRKGRKRLEADLRLKGVSEEVAAEALGNLSEEDEFETALNLARKKFSPSDENGFPREEKAKIYRFLAYRGFGQGVIRRVLEEIGE